MSYELGGWIDRKVMRGCLGALRRRRCERNTGVRAALAVSAIGIYCGGSFNAIQAARCTAAHAVGPVAYPLALSIGEPWKLAAHPSTATLRRLTLKPCRSMPTTT